MKRITTVFLFLFFSGALNCFATVVIGGVDVTNSNEHYLQYVRFLTVPFRSQKGTTWDAGNNIIGKTPSEVQAIVNAIKALEIDDRQKEIYNAMASTSKEVFRFDGVPHAKGVVTQRIETVDMMISFNTNYQFWYPQDNPDYTTTTTDWIPGLRKSYFYRQRSDSASGAIRQICSTSSKTYGECFGGIVTCIWWGAYQGMGEKAFNNLYQGSTALNMDMKPSGGNGSWCKNVVGSVDGDVHIPGDWVYFRNSNYTRIISGNGVFAEAYEKKYLTRSKDEYLWSGENALYVGKVNGEKTFEGLGVRSKTITEMREELMENYNSDLEPIRAAVGNTFGGLDISRITPSTAPTRITTSDIRRVTYQP